MSLKDLENIFVILFSGDDKEEFSAGLQLFILKNIGQIEIEDIQYSQNDKEYTALVIYKILTNVENIYYPTAEEGEDE